MLPVALDWQFHEGGRCHEVVALFRVGVSMKILLPISNCLMLLISEN